MRAEFALGAALFATQVLLWRIAPGGALELGGLLAALAIGAVVAGSRRRSLRRLAPALACVVACASLAELTWGAGAQPVGLAWFARVLCLSSGALLFRTPPQALVLHGLSVVLGLWTASALRTGLDAQVGLLSVVAIGLTAYGVMLARARELRSDADGSLSVGVAPTPWGERRPWLPVALVVALTLAPLAAGWRLPRPGAMGGSRSAGEGALVQTSAQPKAPPVRRVAFSAQLRTDVGHEGLEEPNTRVMTVGVSPEPGLLLLRGAALSRAGERGWFPSPTDEPKVEVAARRVTLDVELLRPQQDGDSVRLFAFGDVLEWRGLSAAPRVDGAGPHLLGAAPARYQVVCEIPDGSVSPADWRAFSAAALIALPGSLRDDADLRDLALRIAWPRRAEAKAGAVIRYLSTNYTYDGTHRVEGADLHAATREFLFGAKRGICVEFASSAAVLLRLAGVPCRVVSGFRTHEREEGRFVVRSRHAHTWVEVAIDGSGWIPFDPSPPAGAGGGLTGDDEPAPAQAGADGPALTQSTAYALPPWASPLLLLLLTGGGLLAYALGQRRLRADVALAQLGGERAAPAAILPDRVRFFRLLEARGFDLTGPLTPREWYAAQADREPELEAAILEYTQLRFSGREPPAQVEAFRRSLRRLPLRGAAAASTATAQRAITS